MVTLLGFFNSAIIEADVSVIFGIKVVSIVKSLACALAVFKSAISFAAASAVSFAAASAFAFAAALIESVALRAIYSSHCP